jgi:hypothetical protein
MQQIDDKAYATQLEAAGVREIWKLAMVVHCKLLRLKVERATGQGSSDT